MEDPVSQQFLILLTATPVVFWQTIGICSVVILSLLILSALTSGSEVAFFSFTPDQIEEFASSTNKKLQKIARLIDSPRKLLATILVLNNFINVAIVMVSTYLSMFILGDAYNNIQTVLFLSISITFLIVFFGEVTPKVLAHKNLLGFLDYSLWLIVFADKIFHFLSIFLTHLSLAIERKLVNNSNSKGIGVEELNQALELTGKNSSTTTERNILKGIVNFGTISVKQIMKSRVDITAFDIENDFHELMDKINKSGYSRVPIFNETIDRIEGILTIKDLIPYTDKGEAFQWQKLIRPAFFVPENKKIDDLLRDFQSKRLHMAIVVDEYGGTSGLVTFEDVVEQIVGEFHDETDEEELQYTKVDKNTYVFEGKTLITDFCRILNCPIALFDKIRGESQSIGGMIVEYHAKLPQVGDKLIVDKFTFTVSSVNNRRIKKVRVNVQDINVQDETT